MSYNECIVTSEIFDPSSKSIEDTPYIHKDNVISCFSYKIFEREQNGEKPMLDTEGDHLICRRKSFRTEIIKIEHSPSTPLKLVGLQVWRGALFLADFVLHYGNTLLKNHTVLELGSGTGLTSIVSSMFAKNVVCTDVDTGGILDLIKGNIKRNYRLVKASISILELDFFSNSWSTELEEKLLQTTVVLAADVIYDDTLTEAFVRTICKLLESSPPKSIYIALERRIVFVTDGLEPVAPSYVHFQRIFNQVQANPPGSLWKLDEIPLNFKQYFNYDRVKELILFRISSEKQPMCFN